MSRVLSALVLIPLLLGVIWLLPPWGTLALAVVAAILAARELSDLAHHLHIDVSTVLSVVAAVLGCVVMAQAAGADMRWQFDEGALAVVLVATMIAAAGQALASGPPSGSTLATAMAPVFAAVYVGLPLGAIVAIRSTRGPGAVMLLVVTIIASDSAQYYTGRALGRRKLAPLVSPAKTVEGAVGGLVAAAICGLVLSRWWWPSVSPVVAGGVMLTAAAVGMLGDLFESALKRSAGVKDSSALIPGHGGMLDRIDSWLFAAPVYYAFLRYVG